MSGQLTQIGRHQDKDLALAGLELQQSQERAALEAALEAEEMEHGRHISTALDEEHTTLVKDEHRKIADQVSGLGLQRMFSFCRILILHILSPQ